MKRFLLFWTILSIILVAPAQERNASNSNSGANEHSPIARETHVTPTQALNVGYTFMRTGGGTRGNNVSKQTMQLVYTGRAIDSLTLATTDCYYVFSLQPKGFVIVAADDRVEPILGYSYDNNFAVANMPDHVRGWLGNYEKQIEAVVKQNIAPEAETATKWSRLKSGQAMSTRSNDTVVGPLLTTTWDQGQYYNAMCPEDANGPDGHVLTGCVATAMAQIVNYWGYPVHGRGSHSYNLSGLDPGSIMGGFNDYNTLHVNFDSATYDFDNMPDILTSNNTQEEVNAVAQLMYHCGVAVNTFYGPSSSGALEEDVRSALISYFGFAHTVGYAQRLLYSNEEWIDSLKANIDRGEPVFYSGRGSGAHAFVLDGYKQDEFFHFNFGWSGYGDGWYLISAINPSIIDLNEWQSAIMGIRPNNEEHAVICHKIMYVQNNDYFTVTEPIDLYPMRGGSMYHATADGTGVRINLNLVPNDESGQLVLDVLGFDIEQSVVIYDGINKDSLVRVIDTRYLDNNYDGLSTDSIFQNLASVDFSPVVSTRHGFTVVVYSYGGIPESFHLRVSDASDCRMVSNLAMVQDNDGVLVSWTENGDATQWQVMVGDTTYTCNETHVLLTELLPDKTYEVKIRAKCDEQHAGSWNSIVVNKKVYWTDVVKSEPEGYLLDGDTIKITTPEGMAWVAHCVDSMWINGINWVQYCSKDISIENDIDLDGYYWCPIRFWHGNVNGNGHVINNMEVNTSREGGLFIEIWNSEITPEITDIRMTNSKSSAGGASIATYIGNCIVNNCSSDKHINGGLFGMAVECQINNCYAYGNWSTSGYGGLVGTCYNSELSNCVSQVGENFSWGYLSEPPERRGLFSTEVHAGKFTNCFSDISNWMDSNVILPSNLSYIFLGNIYNVDVVENLVAFNISSDTTGTLLSDIAVNYILGEGMDVVSALNNKIAEYNSPDYRIWVRDSVTHLPVFGDYYEVTCPNVSHIVAENIPYNGGFAVALSWQENGNAEEWQIKYNNINDVFEDSVKIINVYTTHDTIEGLQLGNEYRFYVRPICGGQDTAGWGQPYYFDVDKTLWVDVVTSCPEGYLEDNRGNVTISSPEGLAWLAKQYFHNRPDTIFLRSDLDMGAYKWTPIGHDEFRGVVEGNNHIISNLYCREGDYIALFGHAINAIFNNIIIANGIFMGNDYVGSLFGLAEGCLVNNCHATNDTVKGVYYVGGLGGGISNTNEITCSVYNCSSSGDVYGNQSVGGLFGYNGWFGSNGGNIKNCYSACNVFPSGFGNKFSYQVDRGGLCGGFTGVMNNCYSVGEIGYDSGDMIYGLSIGELFWGELRYLYALQTGNTPLFGRLVDNYTVSDTSLLSNGNLQTMITIGDSSYTDLLSALNAWVDANDTAGIYRHWAADSANVNGGYPVFAAPQSYILTIAIDSTTPFGEVSGGGSYNEFDNTAIISATAHEGCHFVQWSDGNTDNPRTIVLTTDSTLTAQFGFNMYSVIGTTSTIVDYVFDFEDVSEDANWTLLNDGYTNRWYINMLDDNRILYISNDYGVSNDYDEYELSSVFAYTMLSLDSGQYNFSYDWRCFAELNYDYLRVALIPSFVTLDNTDNTWTSTTLPNDAISLDNEYQLSGQSAWVNQSGTIEVNTTEDYKMVFCWNNDGAAKNVPPAAVDNIHFYSNGIDCSAMGTVLGSDTVPYLDTVMLTAVPNPGYRFVQWGDGNTDNPRIVVATNNKKFVAIFECLPITGADSIATCDSYSWNGVDYFESIVLIDTLTTVAGCDSVVTLYLTVNHATTGDTTAIACDNFNWQGETYTQSGDYTSYLSNAVGCDSVVTLHLTVNYSNTGIDVQTACESFTWIDGVTYTESTNIPTFTLMNAAGCDSVVTLNLTINYGTHTAKNEVACDSYEWHGETYTASGSYTYEYTNAEGCPSVDTLYLTINYSTSGIDEQTACESFTWINGVTYTENTNEPTYTLTNAAGCDSIVTLHLTINQPVSTAVTETACESFTWNGNTYTQSGDYPLTLTTTNGCDSVVTLHLTINQPVSTSVTETTCESFTWNGNTYTQSGDYPLTLTTTNGCDSTVTLHLTINQPVSTTVTETACESFTWNGNTYTQSGDYPMTFTAANGCDSVVTLHLTITNTDHTDFTDEACDSYSWNGETYTQSGDYTQTFTNSAGCDSVVTLHLTVNYSNTGDTTAVACESFTWQGTPYTESGSYSSYQTTAAGCDSIVTLHLTINQPVSTTVTETACESYTWNGETYTQSGDYPMTLTAANGCDSIVTLHLTINQPVSTSVTETACESFTWNGETYTQSGDYPLTLTAANGCDSIVTLHLTINQPVSTSVTETACDIFSWNGNTYTQSGDYPLTLTASNGCDSIVTLHLTITNTDHTDFTDEACNSYTWNGETYTQTGNYTQTFTNSAGCDSVVTLHLTVNYSNTGDTTAMACETFTWHGTSYTQSGDYTYTTTNVAGCDSVVTLHLTVMADFVPQVTVSGTLTACGNGTVTLSLDGTYHDYLWSTDDTTASITVGTAGYYWVTIGDGNGCTTVSEPVHLGVSESVSETPALCMVGVVGNHNMVIWEELTDPDVVGYQLYRENGQANVFEPLTFVPTGIVNAYEDITADPSIRAYRYKITAVDTCGGETPMSEYHKTVHLTINQGLGNSYNLIWTPYEGFEFASYRLYRGTANNNLQLIQTMPSTLTSYTDNNPSGNALFYQIEVVMNGSCVQHTRDITFSGARSNIVYNGTPVTSEVSVSACDSYDWNGQHLTASGDYTQSFSSSLGYDSVVTLHLTINSSTSSEFSIVTEEPCYTWNNIDYCETGDYTQTLQTVHGCDSVVTLHLTITVGIDDFDGLDFKVYPNPTNGVVNVECTMNNVQLGDVEIHIVDMYGKLLDVVETQNFASLQTAQIDLSRYANGIYFVKAVADGETIAVRKVVKQ